MSVTNWVIHMCVTTSRAMTRVISWDDSCAIACYDLNIHVIQSFAMTHVRSLNSSCYLLIALWWDHSCAISCYDLKIHVTNWVNHELISYMSSWLTQFVTGSQDPCHTIFCDNSCDISVQLLLSLDSHLLRRLVHYLLLWSPHPYHTIFWDASCDLSRWLVCDFLIALAI